MNANVRKVRRAFATFSVISVLALAAGACGSSSGNGGSSGEKPVTLVYAGSGGTLAIAEERAWLQPFMKLHPNIKIEYAQKPDFGTLAAAVETGNVPWDVTNVDLQGAPASKYFVELDCKLIPCSEIREAPNSSAHVQVNFAYAIVLAYNKSKFGSNTPKTWADFFDPQKFPGTRVLHDTSGNRINIFLAALMAAGVSPDQITPFNYQLAFKQLDKIKNDLIWTQAQAHTVQTLYSGEGAIGIAQADQVQPVDPDGKILGISWDGRIEGANAISIVKGSKHVKESQELIAYILSAENNARLSDHLPDAPTNKLAVAKANPALKDWYITSHDNSGGVAYPWPWVIENGQEVTEQFAQWKTN